MKRDTAVSLFYVLKSKDRVKVFTILADILIKRRVIQT